MLSYFLCVIAAITMICLQKRRYKKKTVRLRFNANFRYELFIYLTEIFFMFAVFQTLLIFFEKPLGYEGEGFLKRFIDLFTVYQIFVFVVLKLFDSLKVDSCSALLYNIELAAPLLEENKTIHSDIWESRKHYDDPKMFLPAEVLVYGKCFFLLLDDYEENRLNDTEESKAILDDAKYKINMIKSKTSLMREETNFHWNVSLFIRFGKWISSKDRRLEGNELDYLDDDNEQDNKEEDTKKKPPTAVKSK